MAYRFSHKKDDFQLCDFFVAAPVSPFFYSLCSEYLHFFKENRVALGWGRAFPQLAPVHFFYNQLRGSVSVIFPYRSDFLSLASTHFFGGLHAAFSEDSFTYSEVYIHFL